MFADIHCHVSLRAMHQFSRLNESEFTAQNAHIWSIEKANNLDELSDGGRALDYTQTDIARLIKGKTKLAFVALYPFEQGYALKETDKRLKFKNFPFFINNVPVGRSKYIKSDGYNYWKELIREFCLVCRASGLKKSALIEFDANNDGQLDVEQEVKGTFWVLANNPTQAKEFVKVLDKGYMFKDFTFKSLAESSAVINNNQAETVLVFSMEGGHTLTLNRDSRFPGSKVPETEIFKRIDYIKALDPPIFYITIAHHFDNTIISHAKSFPNLPTKYPTQEDNKNFITVNRVPINQGITALGERILLKLLHLERNNNGNLQKRTDLGNRILIDVKHMSAIARKEFYRNIIRQYNNSLNFQDRIPVIASHVAYSGMSSLDNQISNYTKETNDGLGMNKDGTTRFMNWNINLCDEDVQEICHSAGLIGLIFDQRVIGVPYKFWRDDVGIGEREFAKKIKWTRLISDNLRAMAKASAVVSAEDGQRKMHEYSSEAGKMSFWHCISIGSDFDGGIDPINPYPTAIEFTKFKTDLKQEILNWGQAELNNFKIAGKVDEIVHRICFQNAVDFLQKHFPKNYNPATLTPTPIIT
jgi:hypothetical protein